MRPYLLKNDILHYNRILSINWKTVPINQFCNVLNVMRLKPGITCFSQVNRYFSQSHEEGRRLFKLVKKFGVDRNYRSEFDIRLRHLVTPCRLFQRERHVQNYCGYCTKPARQYEIDSNVSKNVLIYSNENQTIFKFVPYFGFVQFLFWGYLAMFVYKDLRGEGKDNNKEAAKKSGLPSWISSLNSFQIKYKNALSILFVSLGYLILHMSFLYPTRTVRQLWLLKGGQNVGIANYGFVRNYRSFVVPVDQICCMRARNESGTQIPLKIKGRWFFFLLDKKGVFHNPKLFDYCVGLHRQFK